jgi:hypothetical protein
MQARSPTSAFLVYCGALATALTMAAVGLTAVVKASTGSPGAASREKTLLEIQVESSREIRRALATPIAIAPLPPITARPARDLREIAAIQHKSRARPALSQEATNAMAMDQSATYQPVQSAPVRDRHSASW